jgi:tRNA-2-methylthio-N6-dimethylallyladenosine synthase
MATSPNICRSVHLPVQSGSSRILKMMHRNYTREWYLERVEAIRRYLPGCTITTDIIAGFCGETEKDHEETLSLMRLVAFDYAYMFKYSERPNTLAAKKFTDDVPEEVKSHRLEEIIALQQELSLRSNRKDVDKDFEVLVEGFSRRSQEELFGRTSGNKVAVFPKGIFKPGDYVKIRVKSCTGATLRGICH